MCRLPLFAIALAIAVLAVPSIADAQSCASSQGNGFALAQQQNLLFNEAIPDTGRAQEFAVAKPYSTAKTYTASYSVAKAPSSLEIPEPQMITVVARQTAGGAAAGQGIALRPVPQTVVMRDVTVRYRAPGMSFKPRIRQKATKPVTNLVPVDRPSPAPQIRLVIVD